MEDELEDVFELTREYKGIYSREIDLPKGNIYESLQLKGENIIWTEELRREYIEYNMWLGIIYADELRIEVVPEGPVAKKRQY